MVLKHDVILLYPSKPCGVAWPVKGDAGYANYMNTLREHCLIHVRYTIMLTNKFGACSFIIVLPNGNYLCKFIRSIDPPIITKWLSIVKYDTDSFHRLKTLGQDTFCRS